MQCLLYKVLATAPKSGHKKCASSPDLRHLGRDTAPLATTTDTGEAVRVDESHLFKTNPANMAKVSKLMGALPQAQHAECQAIIHSFADRFEGGIIPDAYQAPLMKLLVVVGKTLPALRARAEIPDAVRYLFATDRAVSFMEEVMTYASREPFLHFNSHLAAYNTFVLDIKLLLLNQSSEKAISWKPRNEFLFLWAIDLIESTTHPVFQVLKKLPDAIFGGPDNKKKFSGFLTNFFGTLSKTVFGITIVDDIADCIQNKPLTQLFANAPFQNQRDLEQSKRTIASEFPEYVNLFNLYAQVWKEIRLEIKVLIGNDAIFYERWPKMLTSLKTVMESLLFSIDLNENPSLFESEAHIKSIENNLAANMMMTFYKTVEEVMLEAMGIDRFVPAGVRDRLFEAFKWGEVIGHSGNNLATLRRELCEGDISNTLIFVADFKLRAELSVLDSTFTRYVSKKSSYQGLSLPDNIQSLIDLAEYIKILDKQIVAGIMGIISDLPDGIKREINKTLAPDNVMKILAQYVPQATKEMHRNLLEGLTRLDEQKHAVLALLTEILEDPDLRVANSYYRRVLTDFEKLREAQPLVVGMTDYIKGVEKLFGTYLVFKSEL